MGFTEILTIIFIVLKILNVITWSWWLVLLPEIIGVGIYMIMIIGTLTSVNKANKRIEKYWKERF